jgi:hypothetical protein
MARHHVGDRVERGVEYANMQGLSIGPGVTGNFRNGDMIGIAERGRERDGNGARVLSEARQQIGAVANGRIGIDDEGDVFRIEDGQRREAAGVRLGDAHQVVRGHIWRTDAYYMAIAGAGLHVNPGLPSAVATDIDDFDRHIDQAMRVDGPDKRARRAVEATTRWRTRDDLDCALGLPAHCFGTTDRPPSTLVQSTISSRKNLSK